MQAQSLLLTLCVLAWSGSAQLCEWDQTVDTEQSLDPVSLQSGASYLETELPVTDLALCREACCSRPACDLALVGYPQDGLPQCFLISCVIGGHDMCVLRPSFQFKVSKKVLNVKMSPEVPSRSRNWENKESKVEWTGPETSTEHT